MWQDSCALGARIVSTGKGAIEVRPLDFWILLDVRIRPEGTPAPFADPEVEQRFYRIIDCVERASIPDDAYLACFEEELC